MKVHANLIWLRVSERLAETIAADPKLRPLLARRLDPCTFAVRRERYKALRELLVKRGLAPEEVGSW